MQKISLGLIIFLLFAPILGKNAIAQDIQTVSPQLYNDIQKKLRIEELLKGREISDLTEEELKQLIDEASKASSVPTSGSVEEKDGKYIFSTNIEGQVVGELPKGQYTVTVSPIPNIVATLPETYLAASPVENELMIGLKNTTNSTNTTNAIKKLFTYLTSLMFPKNLTQKSVSDKIAGASVVKVPVMVKLFQDLDGDGLVDLGENPVPWANVKVTFTKVSTEQAITYKQGINTVRFENVPENFQTVFQLLSEVVTSGAGEATLISLRGNVPQSVTAKGADFYGADFELKPNVEYLLNLPKEVNLTQIF